MIRARRCLLAIAILFPTSPEAQSNHFEQIKVYAHVTAVAFSAQKYCPGVVAETSRLLALRLIARIEESEETLVDEELRRMIPTLDAARKESGTLTWCASVWSLFGSGGTMIEGVL